MLDGRRQQFAAELRVVEPDARSEAGAEARVEAAIDRLVYYAGWCDKVQQLFSSVNPVSSSHFNFSLLEPVGVVAVIAPSEPLLGLISSVAPVLAGANSCVVLASERNPLPAISFAEVLHTSDVPAGVVNLLTGRRDELLPHLSSHMDVNAVLYCGDSEEQLRVARSEAVHNMKRVVALSESEAVTEANPYRIRDLQEIKTTWHPIGQ
jgi:acyl-CoA reductase-like NAD-dependent aldehyde dehydrogenase